MDDRDQNERRTAADFDPELLRLFDRYVHGSIDRRGFLAAAARFAVAGVTASALLDALSPLRILDRGYAVPVDREGRVLKRREDFRPGESFRLRVADGDVGARVES